MTYLHHTTLTTGHTRRSYRNEVHDVAVAACASGLAIALAKPGTHAAVAVDALEGYTITATAAGACLVATVWHGDTPICTIGVASNARCAVHLWKMLHDTSTEPLITTSDKRPQAPWCAARLEPGLLARLDATAWLGDFERTLAWAWIES
jgi:hypothetical protein